ncbi:hypothetical protein JCM10296v2_001220 [Rhodotorula toruloides]
MTRGTQWRRLVRFTAAENGQEYYGEPTNDGDIGLLAHKGEKLTARVLDGHPLLPASTLTNRTLTVSKLLSPLAPRDISAIRGLGLQYPPDRAKAVQPPAVPCLFFKPSSSVAGPGDEILIPSLAEGEKNDYECELCAVIGRAAKDVKAEDALNYVAGYCVVNDVSSRGLCGKGVQWGMGKAFDSWCPIGPCLVSPAALGKGADALALTTHINGQLAQKASTADLVIKVPELIARLSHGTTLEAGSLILTGSPVAVGRSAPGDAVEASPFMKHGDEVRCFVEGCGTLINSVREESPNAAGARGFAKAKL